MKRLFLLHRRWWWGSGAVPALPQFAMVQTDPVADDWAAEDDGLTEPDGYFVDTGDPDALTIDDAVSTGLLISAVTDDEITVEV